MSGWPENLKIRSNILSNMIFLFPLFISVFICLPENSLKCFAKHEQMVFFHIGLTGIFSQLRTKKDFSFATSKHLIQHYSRIKNNRGQKVCFERATLSADKIGKFLPCLSSRNVLSHECLLETIFFVCFCKQYHYVICLYKMFTTQWQCNK